MQSLSALVFRAVTVQYEYRSLLPHTIWQEAFFLETLYSVMLNSKPAGKVSVRRQGLYYHFSCRCCLNSENIYRLVVCCADKEEKLGILVPSEKSFILNTQVPVKHIGESDMSFYLTSNQNLSSEIFVPIIPEEPFSYIKRLKESYLERRYGQLGVRIPIK